MLLESEFSGYKVLISPERINEEIDSLCVYDGLFYFDEEAAYVIRISDGGFDFNEFIWEKDLVNYVEISIITQEEIDFDEADSLVDSSYDAGIILDCIMCGEIDVFSEEGYLERYELSDENLELRAEELKIDIFKNPKEWIEKYFHKAKVITIQDILKEKLLLTEEGLKIKDKTFIIEPVQYEMPEDTKVNIQFSMPNKNTFKIPCIKNLLQEEIHAGVWIDPFANSSNWAHLKNELNKEISADFHLDALEFLKGIQDSSVDGVIFDPPYSLEQIKRAYKKVGLAVNDINFKSNEDLIKYHNEIKIEIARVLKLGGKAICFGWTLIGVGGIIDETMFFKNNIMLVKHGGMHHDTLISVEIKTDNVNTNSSMANSSSSQLIFNFKKTTKVRALELFKKDSLDIAMIDTLKNDMISYSCPKGESNELQILTFTENSQKHILFQHAIQNLLHDQIIEGGGLWIDPFAERNLEGIKKLCQITNSLNKNYPSTINMDPYAFLRLFKDESVHGVVFNPPMTPNEASIYYKEHTGTSKGTNCSNSKWWSDMKNEIARILKAKGKCITFGKNSVGLGLNRGFKATEIRVISYKDDYSLIIVVEEKDSNTIQG